MGRILERVTGRQIVDPNATTAADRSAIGTIRSATALYARLAGRPACATIHPTLGVCIRAQHDATDPDAPHRYAIGGRS